jgi:hypothetical protein
VQDASDSDDIACNEVSCISTHWRRCRDHAVKTCGRSALSRGKGRSFDQEPRLDQI